jgi:putative DNA primase/helicase
LSDAKRNVNSKGFLLPFKNGVLNTKTLVLLPHDPKYFITHIIPIYYNPGDKIEGTPFEKFLNEITNNSESRLNILRACLYVLFTNELKYQVALYIYGPGGTGKSTLLNILQFLLGPFASLATNVNQINSRFGIAAVRNKMLVVLNDITLMRGQEPKVIKEIITGDKIQVEEKQKATFNIIPTTFVILTSNVLWEIKNLTTGLARRIIYFPFDFVPKNKNFDLFKIINDNLATGTLFPYLAGFINWILCCSPQYVKLLEEGGAYLTSLISPDLLSINPLAEFIKDCLTPNLDNRIRVGNNFSDSDTLYGKYNLWCKQHGVVPLKFNQFSNLLVDQLKQLK